jgi:non-heme chloroperoxidase
MFEYQVNVLPMHGYRCILVDLRGFGRSDAPWEGYGYDRNADDIRRVIDTLRLQHIVLAGFSRGGAIAIRYMSRHAGHGVRKLLLFGAAAPSFVQRPGYPYGATREQVNEQIAATYANRPEMLEQFSRTFFASAVTPSFRSWFNSLALDAPGHSTIGGLVSLRDEDLRGDLARIHAPTFIFHGALDQICPFEFAVLMNQGIAGSTLLRFERSGHGLFYDELELFNASLLQVIR